MTLFGNSPQAQLSRVLFQQDIYRRMLDAYQQRVSDEKFESKKKEEDFWDNYNKLLESISGTKTEIDDFYQRSDLKVLPIKEQAQEALRKLENLRRDFVKKYEDIPKGSEATGWAYFSNRESRDTKTHLNEDFIPFALEYFKLLTTHLASLQPFLFAHACMSEMPEVARGILEERYTTVVEHAQFSEIDHDPAILKKPWENYKDCKNAFQKINTEIIGTWDPWGKNDIEVTLRNYEELAKKVKGAAEELSKKLIKIEVKLEKLWEMKKQSEFATKRVSIQQREPDTFEKIEKLAKLLKIGAITEAEYLSKKAELLKNIK